MSFNSHRRNFSLINTSQKATKFQNRSLRKINNANPHYWMFISAKQHYQSDNMQAAVRQFQLYLSHNPSHMESLYLCAVAYSHLLQHRRAIQKLNQYLSFRKTTRKIMINPQLPSNCNLYLLLALSYTKIEANAKALDAVNQAISLDPKFVQGYCLRAKIFTKLNENKRIFNDYISALKCDSKCLAANIGLGDYYINIGSNYGTALKYYQKAEKLAKQELNQEIQSQNSEQRKDEIQIPIKKYPSKQHKKYELLKNNMNHQDILGQIQLKKAICLYQIQEYEEAIKKLGTIVNMKSTKQFSSEIYYYLGMSQLKYHQYDRKIKQKQIVQYSGNSYMNEAILNLEYSIKTRTNPKITKKSSKTLIRIHMENYQFYEACNIVQMMDNFKIEAEQQKLLCDACMDIIKHRYEKGKIKLKKLLDILKKQEQKITIDYKSFRKTKPQIETADIELLEFIETKKINSHRIGHHRKSSSFMFDKKRNSRVREKCSGDLRDSVKSNHHEIYHNSMLSQSFNGKQFIKQRDQFQWMKPIVYLFNAYAQFFSDSLLQCMESYQQYENYIKDYLGQQTETDIYLSYNKVLCEGILMMDNQMTEQALDKFTTCIDNAYQLTRNIPVEPIIFKILALIRLAYSQNPILTNQINNQTKILFFALEMFQQYHPVLKNHYLSEYYHGLILLILQRYDQSSQILEECLKNVQQCQWKFLYVKGLVQLNNDKAKVSVKEFSAGLLLEEKAQLYLGRCISYLLLYDEYQSKNGALMEKSFEDLQKYIELEDDKQKISIWVTKILFFNGAYEEASKSFKKVAEQTKQSDQDLLDIDKALNVYNGNLQDGGVLGRVLMNAFEGKYESNFLYVNNSKHEIVETDFIPSSYRKWLNILNLYSQQKYLELVKLLQRQIFEAKDSENQLIELKYNLFVVYLLCQQTNKAKNVIASLEKYQMMVNRVRKILDQRLAVDQCLPDLDEEFRSVKRLSALLPYKRINLPSFLPLSIFIKISLPFPPFPKPNILFTVSDEFIRGQTCQSCIPKKIEAPWVKKVTGKIQFTDNLVESMESSLQLKQQRKSEINNFSQEYSSEFGSAQLGNLNI